MKLFLVIHPIDSAYPYPDVLWKAGSGPCRRPTETALIARSMTVGLTHPCIEFGTSGSRSPGVGGRVRGPVASQIRCHGDEGLSGAWFSGTEGLQWTGSTQLISQPTTASCRTLIACGLGKLLRQANATTRDGAS
jgi:hypothetical protein